ncbi:putative amino-acid permease [Metarhizium anisopliae]
MTDKAGSVYRPHDTSIELDDSMLGDKSSYHYNLTLCATRDNKNGANDAVIEDAERDCQLTKSTAADAADMRRMGRSQELVRNFRMFSVASFAAVATAAWECAMFQITPALLDGGRPGLLYSTIWAIVGFTPIYLSMAEMASMAPIAGAQYHWVSEFAPENMQRLLSYVSGVWGHHSLPRWQNIAFALHVLAYFAIIIPVWVNGPKATSEQVWTEFENSGGWPSLTLAVLIGQAPAAGFLVGADVGVHVSEEVRNAATSVPKAMLAVFVSNFLLTLPLLVTIVYHLPDIAVALKDNTSYPVVYVLRQSMSTNWVTGVLVVVNFLVVCSNVSFLTAASRDLFAFSRDKGFPLSDWISKIDPKRPVPQNAAILTSISTLGMALIYLGSPVAFYAISSLFTVALLQCYCLSIGCFLWRRIYYPETLPHGRFSLGRYGIPMNATAVAYGLWTFFWAFWPESYPVTAGNFNWSSVLFATALIGALVHFALVGRHRYHGPVALVDGRKVRSFSR